MLEGDAQPRAALCRGQVVEPGGLVAHPVIAEQPAEDRVRRDRCDHSAISRRHLVEPGAGNGAAGPGHVLEHDGRAAGNMARQMPGDGARIDAEAAAEISADDKGDGLAGIIVVGTNRARHRGERGERNTTALERTKIGQDRSASHQLSSCWRRRVEMASPIEVLDLEAPLVIYTRNTTEISRPNG